MTGAVSGIPLAGAAVQLAEGVTGAGPFGGHATSAGSDVGWHHEAGIFLPSLLGYPVRFYLGSSLERFEPRVTVSVTRTF